MTSAKNLGFVRPFGLGRAQETGGTYTNPVLDGYLYSYGTSDPPREGEKSTLDVIPRVLAFQA